MSAITVVSSNLFAGLSPRNRICFFFYSIISMHWWTSLSHLLFYEKFERDLNPVPQILFPNLSESTFLVTFTTPIKQLPVLNFLFISLCESYSWIKQIYHISLSKSCFLKQLIINSTAIFKLWIHNSTVDNLSNKPFYAIIVSVSPSDLL